MKKSNDAIKKSKAQKLHDYYIDGWYANEKNLNLIKQNIIDHDQFLRLDHRVAGVYKIEYVEQDPETKEALRRLTALYGESGDIGFRWCTYTKLWYGAIADDRGDYFQYYTGLDRNDNWRIEFSVVHVCEDPIERISLERSLIRASRLKPFLQDTCSGKYPKYTSNGPEDCCIAPWTHERQARRLAFEDAIRKYDEYCKKPE